MTTSNPTPTNLPATVQTQPTGVWARIAEGITAALVGEIGVAAGHQWITPQFQQYLTLLAGVAGIYVATHLKQWVTGKAN